MLESYDSAPEGSPLALYSPTQGEMELGALVTYLLSTFVLDVISSVYCKGIMGDEEKQYRPQVCLV